MSLHIFEAIFIVFIFTPLFLLITGFNFDTVWVTVIHSEQLHLGMASGCIISVSQLGGAVCPWTVNDKSAC